MLHAKEAAELSEKNRKTLYEHDLRRQIKTIEAGINDAIVAGNRYIIFDGHLLPQMKDQLLNNGYYINGERISW